MAEGVHLEGQAFLQPGLELWCLGVNGNRHDAHGGATINLLEPLQNRAQIRFPLFRRVHVVNGQDHDRFDARFADPLRRSELGEISFDIERVALIKMNQLFGINRLAGGRSFRQEGNGKDCAPEDSRGKPADRSHGRKK